MITSKPKDVDCFFDYNVITVQSRSQKDNISLLSVIHSKRNGIKFLGLNTQKLPVGIVSFVYEVEIVGNSLVMVGIVVIHHVWREGEGRRAGDALVTGRLK